MKHTLTAKEEELMNIFWKKGEMCIRDLVNSLPIKCCPHCGGTHFKNQVTSAMEQEDVVALTAAKRSPH